MKWQAGSNRYPGTNHLFKTSLVLLLFAIFFFLVGFQELLHDHAPDGEHHTDCPVFGFVITAKASGVSLSILLLVLLVFFRDCVVPEKRFQSKISYNLRDSRAPPPPS